MLPEKPASEREAVAQKVSECQAEGAARHRIREIVRADEKSGRCNKCPGGNQGHAGTRPYNGQNAGQRTRGRGVARGKRGKSVIEGEWLKFDRPELIEKFWARAAKNVLEQA